MNHAAEESSDVLSLQRTTLAFERSRWACERTLMAWIRTCLSLVSAGFAVDRFIAYLTQQPAAVTIGPGFHWYGLTLVLLGVVLLLLAVAEHVLVLRRLQASRGESQSVTVSLPLLGACLIWIVGVIALLIMFQASPIFAHFHF